MHRTIPPFHCGGSEPSLLRVPEQILHDVRQHNCLQAAVPQLAAIQQPPTCRRTGEGVRSVHSVMLPTSPGGQRKPSHHKSPATTTAQSTSLSPSVRRHRVVTATEHFHGWLLGHARALRHCALFNLNPGPDPKPSISFCYTMYGDNVRWCIPRGSSCSLCPAASPGQHKTFCEHPSATKCSLATTSPPPMLGVEFREGEKEGKGTEEMRDRMLS